MSEKYPWDDYCIVGKGANRVCVVDPEDASFCLKFEIPRDQKSVKSWRQYLARYLAAWVPMFNENFIEWLAYRLLHLQLGSKLRERVAACVDLGKTEHGWCLRSQCIRKSNGELAPSIHQLLTQQKGLYSARQLCDSVDEYVTWLVQHDIPLFDLNAGNFVVLSEYENLRLVCIDVKSILGSKELLPLSRLSRVLMRRKILRRSVRLKKRIRDVLGD